MEGDSGAGGDNYKKNIGWLFPCDSSAAGK